MTKTDTSNMTDDQIAKRRETLKEECDKLYEELMEVTNGQAELDTRAMRLECLIEAFREADLVPERIWHIMDIKYFEGGIAFMLPHIEQFRAAGTPGHRSGERPLTVVQKPSKLLGADGKPLG